MKWNLMPEVLSSHDPVSCQVILWKKKKKKNFNFGHCREKSFILDSIWQMCNTSVDMISLVSAETYFCNETVYICFSMFHIQGSNFFNLNLLFSTTLFVCHGFFLNFWMLHHVTCRIDTLSIVFSLDISTHLTFLVIIIYKINKYTLVIKCTNKGR